MKIRLVSLIFCLLLIFQLVILALRHLNHPPFSPDSWMYFMLAKSFSATPYQTNYIRQFDQATNFSSSFPPLYPAVLAVANSVLHLGIYSGYVLNFVLAGVFGAGCLWLSRRLTHSFLPGLLILLTLFTNVLWQGELLGARSMILSLVLFVPLLWLFIQQKQTPLRTIGIAFLAGLLTLNRFDFLFPAGLLGLILTLQVDRQRLKTFVLYFSALFITLSPWIIYSAIQFQTLFISDNARSVLLATKTFTNDYYSDSESLPTVFSHPMRWFAYRAVYKGGTSLIAFTKDLYYNPIVKLLIWLNVGLFFLKQLQTKKTRTSTHQKQLRRLLTRTSTVLPILVIQLYLIGLTGFLDMRYTILSLFFLVFWLSIVLWWQLHQFFQPKVVSIFVVVFLLGLFLEQLVFTLPQQLLEVSQQPLKINQELLIPNEEFQSYSNSIGSRQTVLIDIAMENRILAPQFAALTGVRTVETPSNLDAALLPNFVASQNISYILTEQDWWLKTLYSNYQVATTSATNLYQLKSQN